MRIFLDANILFAASLPASRTNAFFAKFRQHAVLITNAYAIEEARRNLSEKRQEALTHFEKLLAHIEVIATVSASVPAQIAKKDAPILSGAIAGRATHLLTGDKRDFEILLGKTIQGVTIISPHMLADILVKKGLFSETKR